MTELKSNAAKIWIMRAAVGTMILFAGQHASLKAFDQALGR